MKYEVLFSEIATLKSRVGGLIAGFNRYEVEIGVALNISSS